MSKRRAQRTGGGQALYSKWSAPPDPLEQELKLDGLMPHASDITKHVIASAEELAQSGRRQDEVAAGFIIAQAKLGAFEADAQKRFVGDFWKWLMGQQGGLDLQKTPWGAQPCHDDPEVHAYLAHFVQKRSEFKLRLELLRNKAPVGIAQHWLYFKYIIRGGMWKEENGNWVVDLSTEDYLREWDIFHAAFEQTAPGGGSVDHELWKYIGSGARHPKGRADQEPMDPSHAMWPRPYKMGEALPTVPTADQAPPPDPELPEEITGGEVEQAVEVAAADDAVEDDDPDPVPQAEEEDAVVEAAAAAESESKGKEEEGDDSETITPSSSVESQVSEAAEQLSEAAETLSNLAESMAPQTPQTVAAPAIEEDVSTEEYAAEIRKQEDEARKAKAAYEAQLTALEKMKAKERQRVRDQLSPMRLEFGDASPKTPSPVDDKKKDPDYVPSTPSTETP